MLRGHRIYFGDLYHESRNPEAQYKQPGRDLEGLVNQTMPFGSCPYTDYRL